MKESDYIGLMVQETIQISEESEYHELDFAESVDRTIHLQYDQIRCCHIMASKKGDLEIPQNWGPFKNRISHEIYLDISDDKYDFLSILNQHLGERFTSVKLITSPDLGSFYGRKAA